MEDFWTMRIREFEIEPPGENQVLVKIHNCNICTADWQVWNQARASLKRKFPWAPGHEAAGIIYETGVNVQEYKVGDHVAVGYTGCGYCRSCRIGNTSHCRNMKSITREGISGGFGMSQFLLLNLRQVFKVNPLLPYEEACYLEPLSTAIHGMRKLRVSAGDKLLVIGAGNLGLVNAQVAKAFGCQVLVSEVDEKRVALAKSLGFKVVNPKTGNLKDEVMAFSEGKGMDEVILAVATTLATDQAIESVRRSGKILFFAAGYPSPDLNLDVNGLHYGNYELIGTGGADAVDYELSRDFLSDGVVKVNSLISYKVPMDDVQHAFELAATPGNYRVSLMMWP